MEASEYNQNKGMFGSWQQGDNAQYTAYFDEKREERFKGKGKPNNISEGSPEEMWASSNTHVQKPNVERGTTPIRKQHFSKTIQQNKPPKRGAGVPKFGDWNPNDGGFTKAFEDVRGRNNNPHHGGQTPSPQQGHLHGIKQEQPHQFPSSGHHSRNSSRGSNFSVPKFGNWDPNGGGYTTVFENIRDKNNSTPPGGQIPSPQNGHPNVIKDQPHQFPTWSHQPKDITRRSKLSVFSWFKKITYFIFGHRSQTRA